MLEGGVLGPGVVVDAGGVLVVVVVVLLPGVSAELGGVGISGWGVSLLPVLGVGVTVVSEGVTGVSTGGVGAEVGVLGIPGASDDPGVSDGVVSVEDGEVGASGASGVEVGDEGVSTLDGGVGGSLGGVWLMGVSVGVTGGVAEGGNSMMGASVGSSMGTIEQSESGGQDDAVVEVASRFWPSSPPEGSSGPRTSEGRASPVVMVTSSG